MAEGKDARHYVLVSNKVYHLVVEHLTLAEKPHRLIIGKRRSTKGNAMHYRLRWSFNAINAIK